MRCVVGGLGVCTRCVVRAPRVGWAPLVVAPADGLFSLIFLASGLAVPTAAPGRALRLIPRSDCC